MGERIPGSALQRPEFIAKPLGGEPTQGQRRHQGTNVRKEIEADVAGVSGLLTA